MRAITRTRIIITACAFVLVAQSSPTYAATGANINEAAVQAYLYAYPLVMMEMSRRISTNLESPVGTRAPMNQFAFLREYPNASFTDVVAPNADTLYEVGWFDVSKEPMVITTPDIGKRYALFPMLSAWTNVFDSPGTRTTGGASQTFAVTGPGWSGTLPAGLRQVKCATSFFWMIGRIYSSGTPDDFAAVHKLQDQMKAVPLSSYGQPYTPPAGTVDPSIDMKTPITQQVNAMSGKAFFTLFAQLLSGNPPAPDDTPMLDTLAQIGIVPGKPFDFDSLPAPTQTALNGASKPALEGMKAYLPKAGKLVNGWSVITDLGSYGTNYILRAMVALIGLGANLPQDAIYPAYAKPLDGSTNSYVIHFAKDQTPPVNAFWSITLYNKLQYFYDNPLNRYTVSERTPFVKNPDGSIDVYVQHNAPGGEKDANWLPAPAEKFNLIMRLYAPKETPPSILDGTWVVPPVQPAGGGS